MDKGHSPAALSGRVKRWGLEAGFDAVAISGIDLAEEEARLLEWLGRGWHGAMDYMARHGTRRSRPAELVPGTACVISVRLDYWPAGARDAGSVLAEPALGYVSRYATGRDYHKVLRARLQALADRMTAELGDFPYRAFTDSGPVMEVALAARAGLGWRSRAGHSFNVYSVVGFDPPSKCRAATIQTGKPHQDPFRRAGKSGCT